MKIPKYIPYDKQYVYRPSPALQRVQFGELTTYEAKDAYILQRIASYQKASDMISPKVERRWFKCCCRKK